MAKLGSFQEQAGSQTARPEAERLAARLPGGSTSFHAAKGHPSRFRGSEAHSVAQRDLTWRPALLLLTVTDDLGQAQARKRAV